MSSSTVFHLGFILLFSVYTFLRTYFKIQTKTLWRTNFSPKESLFSQLFRVIVSIPLFIGVYQYSFQPSQFPRFYLGMPVVLRWSSLMSGVLSLAGLAWVHAVLNDSFSTSVDVKENAHLVTWGPYRYARHPMYTCYGVFFLSVFLLSQNWLIGLGGMGVAFDLMVLRLPYEERELEKKFGVAYQTYREKTKKFFPWLL